MKTLFLHVDYIKFKPLKKALKTIADLPEKEKIEQNVRDALVVLTAVEKSDNVVEEIVKKFVENIEDIANQVKAKNIVLYPYAHLSSELASPEKAIEVLDKTAKELSKKFKVTRAPFGYYKEFELKVKGHPLSELSREINIGEIENKKPKQAKEQKIILDRKNLPPNDHRIIGEDMKLFAFSDDIGPGLPLWLPSGEIVKDELIRFMREIETKNEFQYVTTPHITKGVLYEKTGHLPYYAESMYSPLEIDGVKYYLKPMNCPHHHMIYKKLVNSYRDLPFKLAEAGTVYRNELSGVTYGLIRVRSMTQNDAHIYLKQEQLKEEFLKVLKMFEEVYKVMGIKNYWFRLSLPDFKKNPDKYTGNEKDWEYASNEIKKAMKDYGKKFVEGKGEAAFYGPKIDVQIKNTLGKEETIATIQ
ncbi:MAG: threonine--tRNA ligase, partial [Nanoarchaeota archaeon]